ncbi:hypothetical protein NFI96_013097, partial [Prochilodus magdalenae]
FLQAIKGLRANSISQKHHSSVISFFCSSVPDKKTDLAFNEVQSDWLVGMMKQEEQTEKKNEEERGGERGERGEREEREEATEESFLKELYFFMKQRDTPIERIPHLGFKQIDLYLMFKTVKDLGGYHQVTAQQLWKKVYNILGGNPRSTSAATCTRRHYEKLLLPYEYHLAGYGDDIPITPPRKHRLPISFDDQYLLAPKRALIRHAAPFNQTPHDFLTDGRLRFISMSGGIPHPSYLHPGPTSLPNLFSVPQSMAPIPNISTPFHPRATGSFLPPSSFETESFKPPLEVLRNLANEYKSSSGLAEPLNLSKKTGRMEILSNTPSSFSPPSSKKLPKFLNEALPLYTARGEQPGAAAGATKVEAPAQAVVSPMNMVDESHAINLISSSRSSPTLKKAPSPTSLHRPSYPNTFPVKQPEKSLHVPLAKAGSTDTPRSSPSQVPSRPDLYNGMEIQIPLSLLQNWIKEGLISSLVSNRQHPSGLSQEPKKTPSPEPPGQGRASSDSSESPISSLASTCQQQSGPVPQDPSKTSPSPNYLSWERRSSESGDCSSGDLPADLSLKNHVREGPAIKHDSRSNASLPTANKSQLPTINRYASVKPFIMPPSPKIPFSRDHRVFHFKGQADEHDTSFKRGTLVNTRISNDTAPRPPGYVADYGAPSFGARLGKASEKASASSSLIHLTPEHLKHFLASAPFRQERGKIC